MVEQSVDTQGLSSVVKKTWPESATVNFDVLEGAVINTLITFCPLYKPGALKESQLTMPPVSIEESRVANKWAAVKKVLAAIQGYLTSVAGELNLHAVFANKAVLLAQEPTDGDYQVLGEHSAVYKSVLNQFCYEQGINCSYNTYTDLAVPGSDFVNPIAKVPGATNGLIWRQLIGYFNTFLESEGIPSRVVDNKKNRRLVEKLHSLGGKTTSEEVYWLVTGYLAFDHIIPKLVGANGLYIATERFEPLFGISNMTPSLKAMPRIHLKA